MQTQCFLKSKQLVVLGVIFIAVIAATITTVLCLTLIPKSSKDVAFMSWNILAPLWIDRSTVKTGSVIDMNLLNDEVRLLFIMDRVKTQSPDLLNLQEVQEDTFEKLKDGLSDSYSAVAFTPNENEYWKKYLTGNKTYIKNGISTFYKRESFHLLSHKQFRTSSAGSMALMSVLQRKDTKQKLIVVNCHLETGVTPLESLTRVTQGNAITNEINNDQAKDSDSIVIIGGDLNTQNPFPGFTNFKSKGFLDAAEEVSKTPFPTFYYEFPVPITENVTTDWVSLDHVFIRTEDKLTGKIKVSSVNVPPVNSDETTRKFYAHKLTEILEKKLESSHQTQAWRILNSQLYRNVQKAAQDPLVDDNNANRVLRLGSDHLPVMVKFHIA